MRKKFLLMTFLTLLFTAMGTSVLRAQELYLYVSCDYNSSTDGWGETRFANYDGAYAYATTNSKTNATIVVEKTNTISGNCFDNNHKNYSNLKVVIKDGAAMGNAASKWDMTYPVTVEPGGTLTCARPKNASVSYIHIKNTLTVGAEGSDKEAYVDFLSDTYQDCDISIRYNGKINVYNSVFRVQDLDAQGTLTIKDSEVYVDGAFASATSFATTLTNTIMTVNGNQISGGISDFAGGDSNRLGKVTLNNSTITINEGTTKVAANVTANGSVINVNDLTINSGKKVNLEDGSVLDVETLNIEGTGSIVPDETSTIQNNGQIIVAMIGQNVYTSLADALTAASAMSGDVTIEIYEKVTLNQSLSGSYSSINFVGEDDDAEIYLDVQGYITATGKNVAFENLKLSKSEGGFIGNAGFMNVAFGVYDVTTVTYTNCTFANGAYASSGEVTYTGCTFYRSHDKYGLWAYGDVEATLDGCTFADYRGIKMYAEGAAKTVDLTVKNTDFSAVDDKPAIVLTYGESVTLENNTYSLTGTFELDLDGAPNGTTVTSDVDPICKNDNGSCGVLCDGKIYTTVAQAAEVATSGSTVTLLHDSTETVVLPAGVILDKNGYVAAGITVTQPVAKIGETPYYTLAEAVAAVQEGQTIQLLNGEISEGTIKLPATLKNVTFKGAADHASVLKDMTIMAADGNSFNYEGLTFDGIYFNNSRISLTGWRIGDETIKDLTVTNCWFKNLDDTSNSAPLHINKDASEAVNGLTFTNNVIDGVTGGSKSGVYAQTTGVVVFTNNIINNVSFRPYIIQLTTDDGVADTFTVTGNTFSGSAAGRAQGLGNNAEGTDVVSLTISNNIFKDITNVQQICYWNFNEAKTTAVLEKNYYDIDIVANPGKIYFYSAAQDAYDLLDMGIFPIYRALNADGTINTESEYTPELPIAQIGETGYETLAAAAAAAQAGDIITLCTNVTEDVTLPAGITFNGNGKAVGNITAAGTITFNGHTKATSFNVQYANTTVNIVEGACLEITGTGRMVIGHGCTFNITGTITDAKTANVAELTPSLIMPGASFTGAGVTFNVTNAYISAPSSYCSSSSSASGTFDFNITNSIWESAGKLAFESQSTAATVNFDLVKSVLNTGSHLVFGVSRGEVVIDNSNVNVGTSRQIENQSTMTVKNGSVVNGAVATSSNAKNPGTLIVDNATYAVTGEFSGSDLGTGTIVYKNDATISAGSITKANIQIDATGMDVGDEVKITANLNNLAGTLEVINNNMLDAKIVDGKIVIVERTLQGEGTEANPYLINNLEDLVFFRDQVNGGVNYYEGKYVALGADINLAGENWVGIGSMNAEHGFMGNFDGKTYKIMNLTITNPALDSGGCAYAGFFGLTEGTDKDNQNTIKNLTIENVTISTTGQIAAAAIAYPYYTNVDNVKVCGNIAITGGNYTAGVLAYTRRCVNASNLTIVGNQGSTITGNQTVGGVISDIQMNGGLTAVYNNFNAEGITITGTKSVGGISGIIAGQTLNTCSVKNVTLVCEDNRVGIVSGSLGAPSTISSATYENVTGATNIIGATFDGGKAVEAKIGDTYYASLQEALNAVVEGTSNGTVELISDIDLTDVNWTPVGTETKPFIGSFNGNEHTIKNLNIVETEADEGKAYVGLFGYAKNATIKNVVFENVNLNIACLDIDHSQGHIGAVAGSLEGTSTIENVTVKGDITVEATFDANGASRVAVVAGGNSYGDVTMKNVHVTANEGSYLKANNNVGALAGQLQGKSVFENCSSNIDVTGKKFFAGGIIGLAAGDQTFTNCHTTGNVTITAGREGCANDQYRVGGIAGGWADGKTNVCTLTECSYTGQISGTNADGSVADPLDYAGYVGRGYTLANCAGSKVVIDGVEYVQAYDDVYGVYEINGVLTINTADALEAVANNPSGSVSIVLGSDITLTETIIINAGQTRTATDNVVTLDLNGRTITGTDNATGSFGLIEIQPGAELIINDSSDDKSGKITLTATNNREWNAYSSVISNQRGKLTVNGGTIEHLGGTDMAYGIDNLTNGTGTYAETVINGGTIKSTYRGIRQFLNGVEAQNILTVTGGTIEGANKSIWMQDPSANANTGTLTVGENAKLIGDVYLYVTPNSTSWPVEVSIAAGALQGESTVMTANVPAGYELKLEDKVYGVKHGVAKICDVLYESLAEAATAATTGQTIELLWQEGQASIAMNATFVGNKTVTITGAANVDWSKGWLYVGRNGEGDGHVIFNNAILTSTSFQNNRELGLNVSCEKDGSNTTNDGKVEIINSNIQLDYLIGKGDIKLDNSTLNVYEGFAVGARPASETGGVQRTVTMDITNGSNVIVKNHNGMGLGYESMGIMNIDATSTFETTQSFLITANGTMNNAGTVNITGTLTNEGTINFTGLDAKLTAQEGLTIVDQVNNPDYKVVYKEGAYQFVQKVYVAKIGDVKFESLQEAVNAATNDATIVLIESIEQVDGVLIENKNIIIDLNEKTFTVTEGANTNNRNFKIKGTSVVTIKNGTMVAAGDYSSGAYGTVRTEGTAEVTLTGLELYNYRGNGLNIKALGGTTVAIDNTEIYSQYGGGIEAAGGTINIAETVKVEQKGMYTAPYNSMAISVNGGGTVTVAGGTYSTECITAEEANGQGSSHGPWVVGVLNSGGTLIINGGTFSNDNFGDNSLATAARGAVLGDTGANIQINGGTFNALAKIIDIQNNLGGANPVVTLKGGTYSADPTNGNISNCIVLAEGYSVKPLANGYYTVIQIAGTQTREFAYPGWYWFSTYIDFESGEEGLDELQEQLGGNAATIKGQTAFTNYQYYNGVPFWTSALTSISASEMYMIKTTNKCLNQDEQIYENVSVSLEGNFVDYEDYEITIHKGWNWIGYPLNTEVSMTEALAGFTPAIGDQIKGKTQGSSSSYNPTLGGWYPDFNMIPGEGYMYYSAASENKTLTYSAGNRGTQNAKTSVEDNHWIVDEYKYSNNMTVIAMLSIDGEIVKGNYEVAAFANGECRGSARPIYIEAIDTYVLFMTIHGDEVEELTFMYYDIDTDTEYELNNVMNYSNDAIVGTLSDPYIFSMNILGIGENSIDNINIYPNPTTTDREINLQATCDKVEVFNALGVKVAEYHNVDTLDALETAGIYVIRITNDNAVKHCRLVVK